MKFGHNIHRYHVVEWTQSYIDYRALKRLYKLTAKLAADKGERAGFTGLPATGFHLHGLTAVQRSKPP